MKLTISSAVGSILLRNSSWIKPAELKRFSEGTDVDITEYTNSQICVNNGTCFWKSLKNSSVESQSSFDLGLKHSVS